MTVTALHGRRGRKGSRSPDGRLLSTSTAPARIVSVLVGSVS